MDWGKRQVEDSRLFEEVGDIAARGKLMWWSTKLETEILKYRRCHQR
jgi:hypothetical protein